MAAGSASYSQILDAGNAPKQSSMKASWEKMDTDYDLAIKAATAVRNAARESARNIHSAAIEKARDVEKNARTQYSIALKSGDQAAIEKAKGAIDNAKAAKKQADTEYKSAKKQADIEFKSAEEQAKSAKQQTHDELRSVEKAHNSEAVVNSVDRGRDLADIQKEQTEKLNNVNSQTDTDNQGTDRGEPTGKTFDEMTPEEQEAYKTEREKMAQEEQEKYNKDEREETIKEAMPEADPSNRKYYDENGNKRSDPENYDENGNKIRSDNGGKDMGKDNNKKGLGLQFSQSFYDNVGNAIKGQPQGNLEDLKAKGANAQAQNLKNAAATNQMEAQRAQQIANQNPYAEAGKMASVQNDAENRQNVQKSGVLGAGAALARKTNTPDVQSQMQREDQQQQVANQRREEEQANQQEATEKGNEAEQWQFKSRDFTEDKDQAAALSKGEPAQPEPEQQQQPEPKPKPEQPEQQPEPQPAQPEQPEQKSEPEPQTPEKFNANWQNVMNYMTYGNDPTSKWSQPGGKDGGAAQKYVEAMGWQPLSESDVTNASKGFDSPVGELQGIMSKSRPEFMQAWNEGSGRVKDGKQINAGDEGYEQAAQTNTQDVESDTRVKDIKQCLCDARMKWIKEDWDRDGKPSREDMIWLMGQQGPFHHNDRDYDPNDYDTWDDEDGSILGAYADNIKNYVYNYKPEATQIDSNIDPNQEHIGPMAQDIEQVNPACIKETPEGVKTVDTGRLSMMNAGAIGDLAREIQDLKARLAKLGV